MGTQFAHVLEQEYEEKMGFQEMSKIKTETPIQVLSKMLDTKIIGVDFQAKQLQGGTVGEVQILTCNAKPADGEKLSYKIVSKTQRKWKRYSDPDS